MSKPYEWDEPEGGDPIRAGYSAGYSNPPEKGEIDSRFGINQTLAAYRREKSINDLSFENPGFVSKEKIIDPGSWNSWFEIKKEIQKARIGTTCESPRFPVKTGDVITRLHLKDIQFIDSEFDQPPEISSQPGDYSATWQTVRGMRWLKTSDISWEDADNSEWLGFIFRSDQHPSTVRAARWSKPGESHFHYHGAMHYGTVGNGYGGDPQNLKEVTKAYIDINFEWLQQAVNNPDHDQKIAVLAGTNKLLNPIHEVTYNSADYKIYVSYSDCGKYSCGDVVRVYETYGQNAKYSGEQRIIESIVQGDPDDPPEAHYLQLTSPLNGAYYVTRGAKAWKVERWDIYDDADVNIQAIIKTNDNIETVRVEIDPNIVYTAILNDQALDIFFIPLLLTHETEQETGQRKFYCAVYPGDIEFEYTEYGGGCGSCETSYEAGCETVCEISCEVECESGSCVTGCEVGCESGDE